MANKNFKGMGVDLFLSTAPESVITNSPVKDLKINPIFKALIPPLSLEEYSQLEENLLENGIREAISIWGDTIVDGHNRYEIAQKHTLDYTTISYDFESESTAVLWIIKNQLGRRNLSAYDRSILALKLKPVIAEQAKINQIEAGGAVPQKSVKAPLDTQKELAGIAGVSHDTIAKVEKIEQLATPEVKAQLKSGDISINKAYQDIKRQENHKEISTTLVPTKPLSSLDGKYDVILCDCPWEPKFSELGNRSAINNYPFMDIKAIKALVIPSADNAILFMWSTATVLKKAIEIMSEWGFEYQTCAVWDKLVATPCQYLRNQHELLLVGIKGKYATPPKDVRISSVYSEKLGKHSKKPDFYYKMIEDMCPGGTYLELFAHKKHSNKWTVWGNQISEESNEK